MKELKALEILKYNKKAMIKFINSFDDDCKEDDEYISANNYIEELDEAIKEFEELNNKSCSKCNNNIFNKGGKEYGCNRIEINPKDMKQVGFYCSKYEAKGE